MLFSVPVYETCMLFSVPVCNVSEIHGQMHPPPPPEKKALLGTGQMYLFACINEFLSIYIVKKNEEFVVVFHCLENRCCEKSIYFYNFVEFIAKTEEFVVFM